MRDIGRAVLAIRAHADEWFVDVDRIAVCGFSAGAHNCAMYATNWHKEVLWENLGCTARELRPAACILGYTLSDYVYMKSCANSSKDPFAQELFSVSNIALLGTPAADENALKEGSPALQVAAHTPPTFLWATSEDTLVPVQHTLLMARALADAKIPFETHIFESGPHGLSTATQSSAMSQSTVIPEVAQWLPMCDTWLKKRFALELPPLSPWEMME